MEDKWMDCETCEAKISANARSCPHCGHDYRKRPWRWIFWLGIAIAIFLFSDANNPVERLVCVAVLFGSWYGAMVYLQKRQDEGRDNTGLMVLFYIVWIIAIYLCNEAYW